MELLLHLWVKAFSLWYLRSLSIKSKISRTGHTNTVNGLLSKIVKEIIFHFHPLIFGLIIFATVKTASYNGL